MLTRFVSDVVVSTWRSDDLISRYPKALLPIANAGYFLYKLATGAEIFVQNVQAKRQGRRPRSSYPDRNTSRNVSYCTIPREPRRKPNPLQELRREPLGSLNYDFSVLSNILRLPHACHFPLTAQTIVI